MYEPLKKREKAWEITVIGYDLIICRLHCISTLCVYQNNSLRKYTPNSSIRKKHEQLLSLCRKNLRFSGILPHSICSSYLSLSFQRQIYPRILFDLTMPSYFARSARTRQRLFASSLAAHTKSWWRLNEEWMTPVSLAHGHLSAQTRRFRISRKWTKREGQPCPQCRRAIPPSGIPDD